MQVKTFEALSIKDCLKFVKNEFGNDAVILSTRKKTIGDSQSSVFEVTAARSDRSGASKDQAVVPVGNMEKSVQGVGLEVKEKINSLDQKLSLITDLMPSNTRLYGIESSLDELKLLLVEVLKSKNNDAMINIPDHLVDIYQRLNVMGIDESYLSQLISHLSEVKIPNDVESSVDKRKEFYLAHTAKWLYKRITIAPKWSAISGSPSIHVFVGPTGVGKTSMVAKIAAQLSIKEKINTLLISFDHQRLAAAEQLRVYARVMNIPFETITRADDLLTVMERYRDVQLVLIDTAGRSPKSPQFSTEIHALNQLQIPLEKHLVLSSTEKEVQLDRAVRQYASFGLQSLMFCKLDESWSYGEIFNLQNKWSLPLSYFGIGQSVPEDIERATRERVVERLMGKSIK